MISEPSRITWLAHAQCCVTYRAVNHQFRRYHGDCRHSTDADNHPTVRPVWSYCGHVYCRVYCVHTHSLCRFPGHIRSRTFHQVLALYGPGITDNGLCGGCVRSDSLCDLYQWYTHTWPEWTKLVLIIIEFMLS